MTTKNIITKRYISYINIILFIALFAIPGFFIFSIESSALPSTSAQGELRSDVMAVDSVPKAISPIVEYVVDNADGTYTAHWGYENLNNYTAKAQVSKFSGNPIGGTTTPPVEFEPGRHRDVFQTVFTGNTLVLTLTGPDNQTRTATAGADKAIFIPAIDLAVSTDRYIANIGDTINLTYTITNKGNTPIFNFKIEDYRLGSLPVAENITLQAGESTSFTRTYTIQAADYPQFIDTALLTTSTQENIMGEDRATFSVQVAGPPLPQTGRDIEDKVDEAFKYFPSGMTLSVHPFVLPPEGSQLMRIEIPRIHLDTPVVNGISDAALKRGPGWYPVSSIPGRGNTAIAGHKNTAGMWFQDLYLLQNGDDIIIHYQDKDYQYQVISKFNTPDDNWSIVDHCGYPALTLTTCDIPGERLIVRAKLKKLL